MNFKEEMAAKVGEIERIIDAYLPEETGYQKTIFEAVNYSVRAGGKRIRPMLMAETYRLFGGQARTLHPFMAAIEMIHTYSLVHDDLPAMDNDLLRRGKPTTHAVYGEAMGVLAGDGLLNLAYETAFRAFDAAQNDAERLAVARALKVLGSKAGIYGMVGGQTVDVESDGADDMTTEKLDFINELKTGALIEAAMMIGAILAGAPEEGVVKVEDAASKVGRAFQIRDDILDVEGDSAVLGKSTGNDVKNEKKTYVAMKGIASCREEVTRLSDEAVAVMRSLGKNNEFLTELLLYMINRNK